MKRVLTFIVGLLITTQLFSQSETKEICKAFFEKYKLQNSDVAIDYLFSNTAYAEDIKDGIDDVKRGLKKQIGLIGLYYGADLLAERTAGPNVVLYTYLVRHSMQAMVFYIMFYRPNGRWQMQSFKFHNNVSDELEEGSKLFRLKENFN